MNETARIEAPGSETAEIEVDLLLEAIHRRYGYDFRNYARASLLRRVESLRRQTGMSRVSEMIDRVLHEPAFFGRFLHTMSISVTEMFRDPSFFRAVREHVVPVLKTYPFTKIWHAGCSTGEEVYSMCILLHEEGILDRTQVYATDLNAHSLRVATDGIYPIAQLKEHSVRYHKAGGTAAFSDYYHARYDSVKMRDSLTAKVIFSQHNLVIDGAFGEMNLIVCRNVLIYFDRTLQDRVLSLFDESLVHRGILCLGMRESLNFSSVHANFEAVVPKLRIFRKKHELQCAAIAESRAR